MRNAKLSKILLATDFSESANAAGSVAASVATALKADLHVIHVLETTVYKSVMPEIDITTFSESPVSKSIQNRLQQYAEELSGGTGVQAVTHFQLGEPSGLITEAAKQIDADLIVTGAHGIKGFRERFVGSNTYRILSTTAAPVLSVPAGKPTEFKKILLPLDETLSTLEKVPWAALFATISGATVQVVGILREKDNVQHDTVKGHVQTALKYLEENRVPTNHFYEQDENYAKAVLGFCDKSGADLICIMSDKDPQITGMFPGGFAHQIIHQSKVAVLTVQPAIR